MRLTRYRSLSLKLSQVRSADLCAFVPTFVHDSFARVGGTLGFEKQFACGLRLPKLGHVMNKHADKHREDEGHECLESP